MDICQLCMVNVSRGLAVIAYDVLAKGDHSG